MRIRAHLLRGMLGLAVAVPTVAAAAPFGDEFGTYPVFGEPAAPQRAPEAAPQPPPHQHKGLFGRRHCVECQRAYAKAHDGVDVPAPPPIQNGAMMHGQVAAGTVVSGPVASGPGAYCPSCQGGAVVTGPMMAADGHAPGYAVVGGPGAMASAGAPGYAVVGETMAGGDPAPIGISRAGQPPYGDPRMAAMGGPRPGGGPYDPSVVPTSVPPAQVALSGPGAERPRVVTYCLDLLGVPKFGQKRRAEEERERQKHAAIAYDQPGTAVTELPASVVYGAAGH